MVGKVVGEYNAVEDLVSNNTLPGHVLPTILGAVVAGNQLEVRTRPLVCCCCASSNVPLPPSFPHDQIYDIEGGGNKFPQFEANFLRTIVNEKKNGLKTDKMICFFKHS